MEFSALYIDEKGNLCIGNGIVTAFGTCVFGDYMVSTPKE
jgi:hypothetical protein